MDVGESEEVTRRVSDPLVPLVKSSSGLVRVVPVISGETVAHIYQDLAYITRDSPLGHFSSKGERETFNVKVLSSLCVLPLGLSEDLIPSTARNKVRKEEKLESGKKRGEKTLYFQAVLEAKGLGIDRKVKDLKGINVY